MNVDDVLGALRRHTTGFDEFFVERDAVIREAIGQLIDAHGDGAVEQAYRLFVLLYLANINWRLGIPMSVGGQRVTAEDARQAKDAAAAKIREAADLLRLGRASGVHTDVVWRSTGDEIELSVEPIERLSERGALPPQLDRLAQALEAADAEAMVPGALRRFPWPELVPASLRGTRGRASSDSRAADRGQLTKALAKLLPGSPAIVARLLCAIGIETTTANVANTLKRGRT